MNLDVTSALRRLSRKDAAIVLLLVASCAWWFWASSRELHTETELNTVRENFQYLKSYLSRLKEFQSADLVPRAQPNASPLSLLEEYAQKVGVRESMSMTPSTTTQPDGTRLTSFQIELKSVQYSKAVQFLEEIASGPALLRIQFYRLERRFDKPSHLDLSLKLTHKTQPS